MAGPDVVDDSLQAKLHYFWKSLWQDKANSFHEDSVLRDPNPVDGVDVPATVKVLRLSKIFPFIGDVMIRDDYDEALRDIDAYHTEGDRNSVIISGHSGIGIIMGSVGQAFTYIYSTLSRQDYPIVLILVKRLLEEKPTILQNNTQYLIFFHTNGVTLLNPCRSVDPESEEYQKTWALVDINLHVKTPAEMLGCPFFLVMASSPWASRLRKLQKYRRPAAYWLMKSFTLAELTKRQWFWPAFCLLSLM